MNLGLTPPQFEFVQAPEPFPLFVGGYGSGKTHAAVCRAIVRKLESPGQDIGYYLPTFDLVRTFGLPRMIEMLESMNLPYRANRQEATISVGDWGQIIFRTMDTPERIVGYEVADSLVDELDTLQTEKAREVWMKILGRNRQKKPNGKPNTVGVATTPEGFRFTYENWVKNPKPGYRIIKAATDTNAKHLPDDYIATLRSSYPSALLQAYLDGEFVNLTSGSVYFEFDRHKNGSAERIKGGEPLHIGMDFNVGKMAAVVFVLRHDDPHAVEEITGIMDTPAMILAIKARYPNHTIMVYPDATGRAREANNASVSDLSLLRLAGFQVLANQANPAIKDRVLSVNAMIHAGGRRRLRVNSDQCPMLVEGLEKQCYDQKGEPDKKSGLDHAIDACGYFISYRYPILARGMTRVHLGGV